MSPSYIVFEGIDGSGKTTQASLFCQSVRKNGITAIQLLEPTYGRYGRRIREHIKKHDHISRARQHELFTLDRREHVEKKIKPLLRFVRDNPSFVIVQDRCYLSAPAYQAENEDEMRRMLKEQQKIAPQPDIIFLLDVPADVAVERLRGTGKSPTLFEEAEALENARQRYLSLANDGSKPIVVIDASRSAATVRENVYDAFRLSYAAS